MKSVALELEFRGESRRVLAYLGPAVDLPGRAARKRRLAMRAESGVESRQLVEPGVTLDAVLAHIEALLAFEADREDARKEAAA